MQRFYVMLGDVIQSRSIENRDVFRDRLMEAFLRINDREDAYTEFSVLKGIDEIGGVLSSAKEVYRIAQILADELHPHQIRLVVVEGQIDIGEQTDDVSKMDGPAFHRASELLERIERNSLLFDMDTGAGRLDTAVSDEINLLLLLHHDWTDRQREIVKLYRRYGTQYGVADALDISQQSVSESLQTASWPMVQTIEERLENTLQEYR